MPRISKTAATQSGVLFDRAANHAERLASQGIISEDLARKFAFQCDMISDHVARQAGLDIASIAKQALTGEDVYDESKLGLDPDFIGEEVSGMIEGDGDEPYMIDEFTQQENRELRQLQEGGGMGSRVNADPRRPMPGRQAALRSIQRLAASLGEHTGDRTASKANLLQMSMRRAQAFLKDTLRNASTLPPSALHRIGNDSQNAHALLVTASSPQDFERVSKLLSALQHKP
jgi:hypothetical protein